jgi:hypothetical protein
MLTRHQTPNRISPGFNRHPLPSRPRVIAIARETLCEITICDLRSQFLSVVDPN